MQTNSTTAFTKINVHTYIIHQAPRLRLTMHVSLQQKRSIYYQKFRDKRRFGCKNESHCLNKNRATNHCAL